jgi:hypothetical protein
LFFCFKKTSTFTGVIIKHGRDIFGRKCIRCIADEPTFSKTNYKNNKCQKHIKLIKTKPYHVLPTAPFPTKTALIVSVLTKRNKRFQPKGKKSERNRKSLKSDSYCGKICGCHHHIGPISKLVFNLSKESFTTFFFTKYRIAFWYAKWIRVDYRCCSYGGISTEA